MGIGRVETRVLLVVCFLSLLKLCSGVECNPICIYGFCNYTSLSCVCEVGWTGTDCTDLDSNPWLVNFSFLMVSVVVALIVVAMICLIFYYVRKKLSIETDREEDLRKGYEENKKLMDYREMKKTDRPMGDINRFKKFGDFDSDEKKETRTSKLVIHKTKNDSGYIHVGDIEVESDG